MITGYITVHRQNDKTVYNKIMIEKNTKNNKNKTMKTEPFHDSQCLPFQFGKPVIRLPIINKKSGTLRFRYDNTLDKSLDSKDKYVPKSTTQKQESCLNVQQMILRKYSNNSQLQLLTFQQLQLCAEKSKKILPKIAMGAPSRQHTDRSPNEDFHKRLNRMKSEKKIDSCISEFGCYKLGAVLGRGNYSIVKLCQTNQGKRFAAKIYPKQKINSPQRQQNLQQQISILKQLNHSSIIKFKQYIQTQENHYIVMQVFDNISLLDFIKKQSMGQVKQDNCCSQPNTIRFKQKPRLNEPFARIILRKVLQGFLYLHQNGISHRDVKLENILVGAQNKDQITVKIIDFGFSCRVYDLNKQISSTETKQNKNQAYKKNNKTQQQIIFHDYCGTPSYISPQIMQKKGYLARPSDVWALGVLIFYMLTGYFPFRNVNQKSQFNNSIFQQINQNIKLSGSLISMLRKMLRNDPKNRPTVKQLLIKQAWFQQQ